MEAIACEPSIGALKHKYGLLSSTDLEKRCTQTQTPFLVEGLIPQRQICLLVGDSGLGKTPFVYQLGLCVATGTPFLGHKVNQGRVIVLDYENGLEDIHFMIQQITKHLGIEKPVEDDFLVHSFIERPLGDLQQMCKEFNPSLVIIDSLRSHNSEIAKESVAVAVLKTFRSIIRETGTSFLPMHHVKKPSEDAVSLDSQTDSVRNWFLQASGTRALVNQSDVRLGVEEISFLSRANSHSSQLDESAFLLRGFGRIRGEIGPVYVARCLDEENEPIGYRRMVGIDLLFNTDQQACYAKLPPTFDFKTAKNSYGRTDQPTKDFLEKCKRVGILSQPAKGQYRKVAE
jgi:hypothetical protein